MLHSRICGSMLGHLLFHFIWPTSHSRISSTSQNSTEQNSADERVVDEITQRDFHEVCNEEFVVICYTYKKSEMEGLYQSSIVIRIKNAARTIADFPDADCIRTYRLGLIEYIDLSGFIRAVVVQCSTKRHCKGGYGCHNNDA